MTMSYDVTLTGFKISKYQVTQELYEAVMDTNPSFFTPNNGEQPAGGETQGKRPVEKVSWYDAIVFCNKLSTEEGLSPAYEIEKESGGWSTDTADWGTVPTSSNSRWDAVRIVAGSTGYRLPTEAQWEYACWAGATGDYGLSEDKVNEINSTTLVNYAWYSVNSVGRTHEVGKKKPNAFGLHDMHGNVWEWCWDWYATYQDNPQNETPVGASSGSIRVIRGGGWTDSADYLRSAIRSYGGPSGRYGYLGFRVVRP